MDIPAMRIIPAPSESLLPLTALIGAESAFARIVRRIREARQEIEIRMFIWRNDSIGNLIADELLAAANRGVKIRIRKDLLGSIHERAEENRQSFFPHRQPPHVWLLTQFLKQFYFKPVPAGVLTGRTCPATNHRLLEHPLVSCQYQDRLWDHSKCYVFDRETLILGGMNIEEKLAVGDVHGRQWRDYMIELRNANLAEAFLSGKSAQANLNGASARLILHPGDRYTPDSAIRTAIIDLLRKARREVIIEMAYFGDAVITREVIETCRRGVATIIVTSAKANVQANLNLHILRRILNETDKRARVYLSPRMIHSKVMLVDGRYVYLGSGNFNRSSIKCAEVGVIIDCRGSADVEQEFKDSLQEAIAESRRVESAVDLKYRRVLSLTEHLLSAARI